MGSVTKAWSFLAVLSLTLIVLGHSYMGREGLLFALVLALGMNSFVYFYEDRRVLSMFRGKRLEGQDSFGLYDIARRLAARARIPVPKLVILPEGSPQSAVIGRGFTNGTILITQGALDKFSRQELEALIAYQIASIKILNTLAFAVGSFMVTLMLVITEAMDTILRILILEKKNPHVPVSQLFTRMVSPLVGLVLRLSIRPSFYKNADRLATQLLGDQQTLAVLFWKLESYAKTLPMRVPLSTAHLFIVSPLTLNSWTFHFIAQPQTSKRIIKLIGYYPI